MRRVDVHVAPDLVLHVRRLHGQVASTKTGQPIEAALEPSEPG
ncbi:hypothetical protein [Gemmatimonas sp.]